MSYYINDTPLQEYLFNGGWITVGSQPDSSYSLSGIWSLPKRTGTTHYDWGKSGIEPYVDANDIVFERRKFEFSVMSCADDLAVFNKRLSALYAVLKDSFILRHNTLGCWNVLLTQANVTSYTNGWGMATLSLQELDSFTALRKLPMLTIPAKYGIDGYSWAELGFVVQRLDNRYDMPTWQPLKLTAQSHTHGYHQSRNITLQGTVKGSDYADFMSKIELLQAVIGRAGVRTIKYFDGTARTAFCVEGFSVDNVMRFGSDRHWGGLTCKMIEL